MGNVPASFMRWRQQNQGLYFAIYASSAAVFYIIGKYTDSIRAWFWDFLPITIGSLSADWWRAFGFTVVASVIAWFFAVTLGYFLGVSAGTARVAITPDFGLRRWMGISLDVAYRSLYVIPFVLTATIAYNITFSWGFSKTYPLPRLDGGSNDDHGCRSGVGWLQSFHRHIWCSLRGETRFGCARAESVLRASEQTTICTRLV